MTPASSNLNSNSNSNSNSGSNNTNNRHTNNDNDQLRSMASLVFPLTEKNQLSETDDLSPPRSRRVCEKEHEQQIDLLTHEIQDRRDEIKLEHEKQRKLYNNIKQRLIPIMNTTIKTDDNDDGSIDHEQLRAALTRKIQYFDKARQVLSLQVSQREAQLEGMEQHGALEEETMSKQALLDTLKQDLLEAEQQLDTIREQLLSRRNSDSGGKV